MGRAAEAEKAKAEAVAAWAKSIRARLVDDDDSVADVDLLYGIYTALTGEEIQHPLEDEHDTQPCGDCGMPLRYDSDAEDWRHVEKAPPTCWLTHGPRGLLDAE